MITGKLMYDVDVEVENEAALTSLQERIKLNLKSLNGVTEVEKVDEDIENDESSDVQDASDYAED